MRATEAHSIAMSFAKRCIITKMNKDKRSDRTDARERVQLALVALAIIDCTETIDEQRCASIFGWNPPTLGGTFRARESARNFLRDLQEGVSHEQNDSSET